MDTNEERLIFTIPEVAKLLGIGLGTAYEAARTGQLPTVRFGRVIRVPRHALEQFLNGQGAGDKTEEA